MGNDVIIIPEIKEIIFKKKDKHKVEVKLGTSGQRAWLETWKPHEYSVFIMDKGK